MSLAIDIDKVTEVLLVDGWHRVADDSFFLDAYEYIEPRERKDPILHFGGGQGKGAPSTGFGFSEQLAAKTGASGGTVTIYGPISAILAVRTKK
jgi:hypothetical protein